MKTRIGILLIAFLALISSACETESPYARVEVWLTDAPGDFEQVRIEVLEVQVHRQSGEQTSGWMTMNTQVGLYDVLTLTNGKAALLGTMDMPAGKISQIRLKLSNRNSVVIGGETYALRVPSVYQSGINIQVNETVGEEGKYKILLDFDVAQSVVDHGNGSYSMNPVIRAFSAGNGGSIKGRVVPAHSSPAVYAILGTDTIASAYTDESGEFLLQGLPAGKYSVAFAPRSGYLNAIIEDVVVQPDQQAGVGEVALIIN